jgi:NAD(P)-dependent dehydrogenase (short-subunit alcohol dehydrogenase family)
MTAIIFNQEPSMSLAKAVVLVTGANRGIGLAFVREALARGARVYAGARDPASLQIPGAMPVRLDVTQADDVLRAARECGDVTHVINNAGIAAFGGFLAEGALESTRRQLEVNFFGPMRMAQAFAPVLARNGGGAILNVLSVLSWYHPAPLGAYNAAKAAGWALTNSVRAELEPRGIAVSALHVGYMDTDMAASIPADQKISPAVVAAQALDGIEAGVPEILADDLTRSVKAGLAG